MCNQKSTITIQLILAICLSSILIGDLYAQKYEYRLEDYCNGNCPTSGNGSWNQIYERFAQDCYQNNAQQFGVGAKRQGCKLELACNFEYRFDRSLDICLPHVIKGCGPGTGWGNTTFSFPTGSDGIHAKAEFARASGGDPKAFCTISGIDSVIGAFSLNDVLVKGNGQSKTSTGLRSWAPVKLDNVDFYYFGHGVHIKASSPSGNANTWQVSKTNIVNSLSWAWYVEGDDANAGLAQGLNVSNACTAATPNDPKDGEGYQCWGLRDRSFLGNTYIAPHVAYVYHSTLFGNKDYQFQPYIIQGADARTVVIGAYQEAQSVKSDLRGIPLIIGGFLAQGLDNGNDKFRVGHGAFEGISRFRNATEKTEILAGNYDGALAIYDHNDNVDLRLKRDDRTRFYGWRPSGGGAGELGVTTRSTTNTWGDSLVQGRAWLGRNGAYYSGMSQAYIANVVGYANDPNTANIECGTAVNPTGSRYKSTNVSPGSVAEWVCTCSGSEVPNHGQCTQGTWLPTSTISTQSAP